MMTAYKKFWLGYLTFRKRTSRKDFWQALLVNVIIMAFLAIIALIFSGFASSVLPDGFSAISLLFKIYLLTYSLAALLPFLAMTVRRLNDAGLPWGLVFLNFLPLLGTLVVLILCLLKTNPSHSEKRPVFTGQLALPLVDEQAGQVSLGHALIDYFKGYFTFHGRSTRAGFWWIQLIFGATGLLLVWVVELSHSLENFFFGEAAILTYSMEIFLGLYVIALLLPTLALHCRRLYDTGLSAFGITALAVSFTTVFGLIYALRRVNALSYGIHDFHLANYLLFLVAMVLIVTLLYFEIMKTDEILKGQKNRLFRTKD